MENKHTKFCGLTQQAITGINKSSPFSPIGGVCRFPTDDMICGHLVSNHPINDPWKLIKDDWASIKQKVSKLLWCEFTKKED